MDRRERLISIFEDTRKRYSSDPVLKAAALKSAEESRVFEEGCEIEIKGASSGEGKIFVSKRRSFEAAMKARKDYPDARTAVLNFASATSPGGGVLGGSGAQEECLCRCSTLYPCLAQEKMLKAYYEKNIRQGNNLHTDSLIYSPDIVIFKSDTDYPEIMEEKDWVKVDVITCAAPNLRRSFNNAFNTEYGERPGIGEEELYAIHLRRGEHILRAAIAEGAKVLILGAFGCGAFRNDPKTVARAYGELLEKYAGYFDKVEFAVYCRGYETENYDAFKAVFPGEE